MGLGILLPYFLKAQQSKLKENCIKIKVRLDVTHKNDTLYLYHFINTLKNSSLENDSSRELLATMDNDSLFRFIVPINSSSGQFVICKKTFIKDGLYIIPITRTYLPEFGDDVLFIVSEFAKPFKKQQKNYKVVVKGKGAEKYNIQEEIRNIINDVNAIRNAPPAFDEDFNYNSDNAYSRETKAKIQYLESKRGQLSAHIYNILKADIIYRNAGIIESWISAYIDRKLANEEPKLAKSMREKFRAQYNKYLLENPETGIPVSDLIFSRKYIPYILSKTIKCDFVVNGIEKSDLFNYLKNNYRGIIRDRLLTTYFLEPDFTDRNTDFKHLPEALTLVKSEDCLKELKKLEKAATYNFSLQDLNGKMVKMSDFAGKLVLIDFWFTGCGACKTYYKDHFSAIKSYFRDNTNVVFVSICIDENLASWKKSVYTNEYSSIDAVNLTTFGHNREVLRHYGISVFPSVLLIGKNNKVLAKNDSALLEKDSAIKLITKVLNDF